MDFVPSAIEDIRKSFFPVGGHRCRDGKSEKEGIAQILTNLAAEIGLDEIQNTDQQAIASDEKSSLTLMVETASLLLNMLDILIPTDLCSVSAEQLQTQLHGASVDASSSPPPEEIRKPQEAGLNRVNPFTFQFQKMHKAREVAQETATANSHPSAEAPPCRQPKSIPNPAPNVPRRGGRGRIVRHAPRRRGDGFPRQPGALSQDSRPRSLKKNWNGPGMDMLPVLYGEALHQHKKFAPVDENWTQESSTPAPKRNTSPSVDSNHSYKVAGKVITCVKVYQEEDTMVNTNEERERMINIARCFQIQELAGRGGVLCYTFVRSSGERSKIVIVVLSPSWYLWKDNLEQNVQDEVAYRSCNLAPWLNNPTGSDAIKLILKEMSKQNVRDLLLTSLRNFDKIRQIDMELGQVLEVLFFNWKQPTLSIPLL